MVEKKPNFFIVGAARSGTTTLYYTLKKHPDIFMSPVKEPNYFCNDNYGKKVNTWEEYLNLFKKARDEKIIGEASPKYLYCKEAPQNIKSKIRNPKILIQLRNPVDRAISHYQWEKMGGKEPLSFKEAIKKEKERIEQGYPFSYHYVHVGLYYEQVKRFIDTFGGKNVKITIFEELIKNPKKVLKEIYEFLEVDTNFVPNEIPHYNISKNPKIKIINNFMGKDYFIQKLIKKLVPFEVRKKIVYTIKDKLNVSSSQIEIDLSKWDKINLYKKFLPDVKKLENLTNINFSIWTKKYKDEANHNPL